MRTDETVASVRYAVDRRLGAAVTATVAAHHRRRLARVGQEHVLAAGPGGWAEGTLPPRAGCSVEILVDGAEAAPRMAAELVEARSHVYLAGWYFSPEFALVRGTSRVVLRNLLAELSERVDVYLLVWAGAPLPLFRPSRRTVQETMDALCRGTKIRWAADAKERPMHCHHEKTIVVDDRVAFVGGMDLTLESGDRFDSSAHVARAELGWHDVSARLAGPAVTDVASHFRMRWREVTGESLAAPAAGAPAGATTVQVARTVPERMYSALPRGEFSVLESYVRALRAARRLIYLENQFLWSPEIATVLVDKLSRPPSDDFRLVLLLPAKPNSGADDTRGVLAELLEADDGAGRLLACTIYARHGRLSDPVYVHAKVGIVDDEWLTLGSANLNEHSLFNDTEVNLVCHDPALARATRLRLWSEHLERPETEIGGLPAEVVDGYWRSTAREQRERRDRGEALTHRLVELQSLSSRRERLLGPLQGLLVDG
jgi:phosphatidylserine/phosphatidylglycerophosphate/cardiolipin synthase-like enzyme